MVSPLGPLRFQPLFRRYLWGGRRLGTMLGKLIGEGDDYAESWELVDRGADQSRVAAGPLAGVSLSELLRENGEALLGRHYRAGDPPSSSSLMPQASSLSPRFPLLIKFLDAQKTLSVQVHPNDAQAARLNPPDLGKTEAWIVLAAEPGSRIYAGLKRGFDRAALEREVARGTGELCLHHFEPRVGDCVFLPAGTVHALGAGLMVAEIQQSSDTTYRLYDWNRVGPDGQPRPLHVAAALDAIDYRLGPIDPVVPRATDQPGVSRLVECDKFVIDRREFAEPQTAGETGRCHILIVLDGAIDVAGDPSGQPLGMGQTMLLPTAAGPFMLAPRTPRVTLLDVYLP